MAKAPWTYPVDERREAYNIDNDNYMKSPLRILTATFLAHFSVSIVQNAVGPLAPFLQESLAISRTQIGLLTSVLFLGSTVMAMPAGTIVERLGIRAWIFLSPAIMGLCALFFAQATSFTRAIVAYLIAGFAFAFVNPATTKAIIFGFPQQRRGTAIGIKQTGVPAGGFLVSVALPGIAVWSGWQLGMTITGIAAILGATCGWLLYTDRDSSTVRGETTPDKHNARKDLGKLLHNSDFLLTSGLEGIFSMSQSIIRSYLTLYLVESIGYSTIYAGFIVAFTQLSGLVGRILWGLMGDILLSGRRVLTLQVIGFVTVPGLIGLGLLNQSTPVWLVWVVASVAGAGSLGFAGNITLLRAELAGKRLAATSTGMGMALGSWGVLIGPPLFGFVVDTTMSYRLSWEMLAVLTLVATLLLKFVHEPTGRVVYKESLAQKS